MTKDVVSGMKTGLTISKFETSPSSQPVHLKCQASFTFLSNSFVAHENGNQEFWTCFRRRRASSSIESNNRDPTCFFCVVDFWLRKKYCSSMLSRETSCVTNVMAYSSRNTHLCKSLRIASLGIVLFNGYFSNEVDIGGVVANTSWINFSLYHFFNECGTLLLHH